MKSGADKFLCWLDMEDAYCQITYMPACNELEIEVSILGEGHFYRKRAGNFELFLRDALKHYKRDPAAVEKYWSKRQVSPV